MSYYSRAKTDLTAAAAKGIITPEQLPLLISHFEERRGFFSKITLAQWLAAAGGIFIAIGIILIIAFNWDKLGNIIKIFAYLMLLGGAGWGFYKSENRPVLRNILGLAWFFLPAAGIGLYAQIFQLSGTPVRPYLLWAALSAPLAIWGGGKMYSRLLSVLLLGILFYGTYEPSSVFYLCLKNHAPEAFSAIAEKTSQMPAESAKAAAAAIDAASVSMTNAFALKLTGHWMAALALLATALGINFFKKDMWSIPVTASLVWIILLMLHSKTLIYTDNFSIVMSSMIASALFIALFKMKFNGENHDVGSLSLASISGSRGTGILNNGFRIWVIILYVISFMHSEHNYSHGSFLKPADTGTGFAISVIIIGSVVWAMAKTDIFQECKKADNAIKTLFIASILTPMMPSAINAVSLNSAAIMANIILLAAGGILLWAGSFYGSKRRLHTGMFIIMAVAITRFLDLFSTQLTSGMAFILTGMLFAFIAWWVSRGATQMAEMSSVKNMGNNANAPQETEEAKK